MGHRDVERSISTLILVGRFVRLFNLVSTVRFKRFKRFVAEGLGYHRRLEYLLASLTTFYPNALHHPLLRRVEKPAKVDLVVFFSKRGFVGDLNTRLVSYVEKLKGIYRNVETFAVGERGKRYLKGASLFLPSPVGNDGSLDFEGLKKLVDLITERVESGKTERVVLVYPTPRLRGKVERTPFAVKEGKKKEKVEVEVEFEFEPEKKLESVKLSPGGSFSVRKVEFLPPKPLPKVREEEVLNVEGSPYRLVESLLRLYLFFSLKFVLLESLAAETLARLNATSAINRRIEEKLKELKFLKFKLRQEAITEELAEINAAISALGGEDFRIPNFESFRETLEVSSSVWKTLGGELRKLFPSVELKVIENLTGFRYLRVNYTPNAEEPSLLVDATVEGLLNRLLRFLRG